MRRVERPGQRSARPRSRWAALAPTFLLAVAASLVNAGIARAQLEDFPDASQVAGQVSQATQAAGAQAATLQHQPTNVAIQILVNSPGSKPVISQANEAAAAAVAENANTTEQATGQLQSGKDLSEGVWSGQAAEQGAKVAQDADAQAAAGQEEAANVALSIVVNSPASTPAVTQVNGVGSHAGAANANFTTQNAGQAQAGGAAPGQAGGPPSPGGAASGPPSPGGTAPSQLVQELLAGIAGTGSPVWIWIWDWDWTWNSAPPPQAAGPSPTLPQIQLPTIPFQGWSLPEIDVDTIVPDLTTMLVDLELPATVDAFPGVTPFVQWPVWPFATSLPFDLGPSAGAGTPTPGDRLGKVGRENALSFAPPLVMDDFGALRLSSTFVQSPTRTEKTAQGRLKRAEPPLPTPGPSVPGGAAAGLLSAAGFALGALFLLALQLASAASAFGRRFDLASAAWRRQAYLTPLERPG
jgi:hypothetical protein